MSDPTTGPFGRVHRLRRRREFQRVSREGRRVVVPAFVVLAAHRSGNTMGVRLGLTMSRRVGGAVVRNRLKRRVREWFRRERAGLRGEIDLVVIGRRGAGEESTAALWQMLDRAAAGLDLVA